MIETLRPGAHALNARVALFDFDGTLSLIRSGWVEVMVPMMVEILADLKSGESDEQLNAIVLEYVGRLTGRQTIYQMISDLDADGSGQIDFDEFLRLMTARISDKDSREDIRKVFNLFDDEKTGTPPN